MSEASNRMDRIRQSRFFPTRLFGGRMRTSTLGLCILWIVLYSLNSYLNPAPEQGPAVTPTQSVATVEQAPPGGP